MRVLSVLLSLLCLSGVSAQFALLSTSTAVGANPGYYFNVSTLPNPTLNLTAGNSYIFDISAITSTSPAHPFYFSSAQNPGNTTLNPLDPTVFTVTVGSACVSTSNAYTGNGCNLTLAINATATNQTIWYKCTFHSIMNGPIVVTAAPATTNTTTVAPTTVAPTNNTGNATTAAPTTLAPTTVAPAGNNTGNATTAAPTTTAPTTLAPTTAAPTTPPTVGGTITGTSFKITGNNGTSGYYFTDANGVVYANPTLRVPAGSTVTISFEWLFSQYHPFGFSNISTTTGFIANQTFFPDAWNGWTVTTPTTCDTTSFNSTIKTVKINTATWTPTNPCKISIATQATDAGLTLYYRCANHKNMVGTINVYAPPASSSSSTGNGGGNSASTATLSGLTMVFAMIVALMA